MWSAIDGPGICLGVCAVFVCVASHTGFDMTHHSYESLRMRGFYHFYKNTH